MSCRKWETMLVPYLAGDLDATDRHSLEAHLLSCASCRRELELVRELTAAAREIGRDAAELADQVDWSGVERSLMDAASVPVDSRWLAVAAQWALAACVLLVAGIVWLAPFRLPTGDGGTAFQVDNRTLNRMESELARREVADYLKKSRMVLTELMAECPTGETASRWAPTPAVRKLMAERRLFDEELNELPLQHARTLCRRLDMVFTELAGMDSNQPCTDVNRLQRLVNRDNLLLKIRLVEQELKGSEG